MPGSGKQSAQVQQQIIEFLEAGIDPTTIHRRLKVGRSSIYRMKRCLQQHGTPYAPPETNKKNGRPKVMTAEQEAEIRTYLQHPPNRDRYLDDMVWFIHDRFGMVCSTTTCSKIKRKWLKVIEAEERGERLDPAEAQEQARLEAFRVGSRSLPDVSGDGSGRRSGGSQKHGERQVQSQSGALPSNSLPLSLSSAQIDARIPSALNSAGMLQHQHQQHHQQHQHHRQQQHPLPQYATQQLDQNLLHGYKPSHIDQQSQEHLQTKVFHTTLHQHQSGVTPED